MPLGYLGYMKLANSYLLASSSGLNRVVEPIKSEGVWGAGWYNAADFTNYADNQQHFEGSVQFELQGNSTVWNLIRDWLVEQRVYAQSLEISPNGIDKHTYALVPGDPRTGAWLKQAQFTIGAGEIVSVNASLVALRRTETSTGSNYKSIVMGPGAPEYPLNPAPHNMNPIPGWSSKAIITWPGAPPSWSEDALDGFVLMNGDVTVNNNTQIIKGCTGSVNPAAVMQGTIAVDGSIVLWRDGSIPDPYDQPGTPHTATGSSIEFRIGETNPLTFSIPHVLLTSDTYNIQGKNSPTTRSFGFSGLGDGTAPPFLMSLRS